jgi:hypothetical protein
MRERQKRSHDLSIRSMDNGLAASGRKDALGLNRGHGVAIWNAVSA